VRAQRVEHALEDRGRRLVAMLGDDIEHRLLAEPNAGVVAGIADAVGEEQQEVGAATPGAGRAVRPPRRHA
jgi:hypothetical protein